MLVAELKLSVSVGINSTFNTELPVPFKPLYVISVPFPADVAVTLVVAPAVILTFAAVPLVTFNVPAASGVAFTVAVNLFVPLYLTVPLFALNVITGVALATVSVPFFVASVTSFALLPL